MSFAQGLRPEFRFPNGLLKYIKYYMENDAAVTSRVNREHSFITKDNDLRLEQSRTKYDLRKCYFTNRAVNIRNSLPNHVVLCYTANKFKSRLEKYHCV